MKTWPAQGKHILAHCDEETLIVYQAYPHAIGEYAIKHQQFGGPFSYTRMTWVKPNFLWMMYRSGWGTKDNQQVTLGLRIRRAFFDSVLAQAVPSSWDPELYPTIEAWHRAVAQSNVRLQWDPDHGPQGQPVARRAIQLGLRGDMIEAYGKKELLEVIDLSTFVEEQRRALAIGGHSALMTPVENIYRPADPTIGRRLGLSEYTPANNN